MRKDFVVSILLKENNDIIKQIDEEYNIKNIIGKALSEHGYKFLIADEDYLKNKFL